MSTTSVYRVYDERDQLLYVNHAGEKLSRRLGRIAAATGYRWEKEELSVQISAEIAEIVGSATAQVAIEPELAQPTQREQPASRSGERSSVFVRIPAELHHALWFTAIDAGKSLRELVGEAIEDVVFRKVRAAPAKTAN